MKKKYKLAGSLMAGVMMVSVLTTACAKDVECYVAGSMYTYIPIQILVFVDM